MKASIRAICTHETALGLALAGLAPLEASTGDEAARVLDILDASAGRGGLILIEQALFDALPQAKKRQLARDGTPILMPFPSPASDRGVAPEHDLLEVLRRAVGYRVRLR